MKSKPDRSEHTAFEKFDSLMSRLLQVPHSELKAKLEAEKRAKARKRKPKASASRASGDKD